MDGLSEDDSSDSSNEYLVDPEKINLNSSFFAAKKSSKVSNDADNSDTGDESSDDEDLEDINQPGNIELFTEVLKNLEFSQKLETSNNDSKNSISDYLTSQKKAQNDTFNEINELLLQGETNNSSPGSKISKDVTIKEEDETTNEYTIPKDGVNIVLPGTSLMPSRKRKKGQQDLKAILRKRLRATQILIEKVGLLCWLAYGFHLNRQINQSEIMASGLSLMPSSIYPKDRIDLKYLERFTKWFRHVFTFEPVETNGNKRIDKETMLNALKEKKVSDYKELVILYIATLRALGLNCRLVISLCPPHKVYNDCSLFKNEPKEQESKSKVKEESKSKVKEESKSKPKKESSREKKATSSNTNSVIENSREATKNANAEAKKRAAEILRSKSSKKSKIETKNETSEKEDKYNEGKKVPNLRQLRSHKININPEEKNDLASKSDGTKSKYYMDENSTDSEAEFQPKPKRVTKKKEEAKKSSVKEETADNSKKKSKKNNKKLISSDSEDEETSKGKKGQDIWAEVYLESEETWICANVVDEKIHCVNELYRKATKPVLYVVCWNSNGLIKDVTRRYCAQWLTVTRKQRIDEKWWLQTLSYWKEKDTAISREEDQMLLQRELEQPLPKTTGACKGHPLYVIQKHLLKFEALYPPDCVPLGFTSLGDAIYSRHCVHTLCSRETWLKKAKVVKPNQEPYKIVTARPKYDKLSGTKIKDLPLELFGEWQTMQYEPPEAKDGIVPRNEYGNVDLFQKCMLPKGTVHIDLPALNRVARKLNIDCVPAVVGFNFGCMGAVPALEGYVVCSEYEDTLREAWEAEQAEASKRAKEKREKRIYGNWKKLINGLRIRERLVAKYEFSKETKSVPTKRKKLDKADEKPRKQMY